MEIASTKMVASWHFGLGHVTEKGLGNHVWKMLRGKLAWFVSEIV